MNPPRAIRWGGSLALVVSAVLPATGLADTPTPGDIPDNQAFVRYTTPDFSLRAPEGWSRTRTAHALSLTDKYNAIAVEVTAARTRPTVAWVEAHELAQLRRHTPGFAAASVTTVSRPAGPVILVRYRARS